ncbi:MAG: lysylphosphatidylglycerol synthase domain-containing protein [Syntrophales bacterium]
MKKFHVAAVSLGAALLFFLIWKIGPDTLWRELLLFGWGFIPFVLMEGIVKAFHTLGWRYCLFQTHRSLGFSHLMGIYMAGSSVNYFTPTATLGGEVVKGALLYSNHRGPEAATGVIIGKATYALSQLLFASLGSMLFIWSIPVPAAGLAAVLTTNTLVGAGIIGFMFIQKHGKLGSIVRWLSARRAGGEILRKRANQITDVDQALRRFYREHPGDLLASMLWHIAGMVFSILKTWYFLFLLSGGSFFNAAGIWFFATWLDLLTFPIPLEIGIQEGIRVLVFRTAGFNMALGLAYGIAIRLEQILWAGAGLFIYTVLLPERREKKILSNGAAADNDP